MKIDLHMKVLVDAEQGQSETQIAEKYQLSTTQVRALKARAREERRITRIREAQDLATQGYNNVAIARKLGVSESAVRNLLKEQIR